MKKRLSFLLYALVYLFSLLPWWLMYRIADLLYIILNYIMHYRQRVIDENLKNAFPAKTDQERQMIRNKYYRYLADLLVETVKLFSISKSEIEKRVHVPNPELIQHLFASGHSVIGVLGHYGNWEMNALRFSQLFNEPRMIVYKPLSNSAADGFVKKMRSRFGAALITMKQTARTLINLKNTRTVTVMVSDQTPAKSEIQYYTPFLNQATPVFLGVEKIAKATRSAVVFCDIRRLGRGLYRCTFIPLFNDTEKTSMYEITNAHVKYLEKVINETPEYWLWSHRRWKYKPVES